MEDLPTETSRDLQPSPRLVYAVVGSLIIGSALIVALLHYALHISWSSLLTDCILVVTILASLLALAPLVRRLVAWLAHRPGR